MRLTPFDWQHGERNQYPRSRLQGLGDSLSDPLSPDIAVPGFDSFEYVPLWTWGAGGGAATLYKIQGITKDSGGSPLGGCVVDLFRTSDDLKVDSVVSDAAGNYLLYTPYLTDAHYCVAYKALAPDVTGATVNTLTPFA